MKTCTVCKTEKQNYEFYKNQWTCKKCKPAQNKQWDKINPDKRNVYSKEGNWKRQGVKNIDGKPFKYVNFQALLIAQNFKCASCFQENKGQKDFHVDHNHNTGIIRALLCGGCNRALGFLRESKEKCIQLYNYIGKYNI